MTPVNLIQDPFFRSRRCCVVVVGRERDLREVVQKCHVTMASGGGCRQSTLVERASMMHHIFSRSCTQRCILITVPILTK